MNWAVNTLKLDRAKKFVDEEVKAGRLEKATEDAVKERYIALGGLVSEEIVKAKKGKK